MASEECEPYDIDILRNNYQKSLMMAGNMHLFLNNHINCSMSTYTHKPFHSVENPILIKLTDLKEEHICET